MTSPPFGRTTCACSTCRECCRRPGCLGPGDVDAIAEHLNVTRDAVLDWLQPGKGALVADVLTMKLRRIPSLIPKVNAATGRCVFSLPDERCGIHEVSPFGCRYFDPHMSAREGQRRSAWGLIRSERDAQYAHDIATVTRRTTGADDGTRSTSEQTAGTAGLDPVSARDGA